jgi:hypothetical protein
MLAAGAPTDEPHMRAVTLAHAVFQTTGKAVWPWEVEDALPDEWLDTFYEWAEVIPIKRAKNAQ